MGEREREGDVTQLDSSRRFLVEPVAVVKKKYQAGKKVQIAEEYGKSGSLPARPPPLC